MREGKGDGIRKGREDLINMFIRVYYDREGTEARGMGDEIRNKKEDEKSLEFS